MKLLGTSEWSSTTPVPWGNFRPWNGCGFVCNRVVSTMGTCGWMDHSCSCTKGNDTLTRPGCGISTLNAMVVNNRPRNGQVNNQMGHDYGMRTAGVQDIDPLLLIHAVIKSVLHGSPIRIRTSPRASIEHDSWRRMVLGHSWTQRGHRLPALSLNIMGPQPTIWIQQG